MTTISALTILSTILLAAPGTAARPTDARSPAGSRHPCRSVHTFDFWIGDFEARPWTEPHGTPTGRLHNTREYDGCAIVERWDAIASGIHGMSISFYDTNRRAWRMVWIADDGLSNDFEGTFSDGAMRFRGWVLADHGNRLLASNVLENVSPGTIRHVYSTSSDGGRTWDVKSDGRFARIER